LISFVVLLAGCQGSSQKTISESPGCPQWNEDEWASYAYSIELAERIEEYRSLVGDSHIVSLWPSVMATGAILQHCFPEEFEENIE
jgi:hypothetical protein